MAVDDEEEWGKDSDGSQGMVGGMVGSRLMAVDNDEERGTG